MVNAAEGSPAMVVVQAEIVVEGIDRVDGRRGLEGDAEEVGRDEVEIEVVVDERTEEEEFRRQKEEALKELRQCVDAAEGNA